MSCQRVCIDHIYIFPVPVMASGSIQSESTSRNQSSSLSRSSSSSLELLAGSPLPVPPLSPTTSRESQRGVRAFQAQIGALSDQLNRSRGELHYYLECIHQLEEHATHAFEHVSEAQHYVDRKIAMLETCF
ncbi:hypothetical protein PanWU01x14_303590 [Parasponia andersonii]|uniref:Uncharacterized protein n=1 Tax=Parasponia andersonii TaxID=3476 RepID=A0A2P5AT05_PARAD|nr:hypothetical protein PanWU01x14_303590 [Parasponia andersonii]